MKRQAVLFIIATALAGCLGLAGCGSSSYVGSWYYCYPSQNYDEIMVKSLTLDKDGMGYDEDGDSFQWTEIDGGFAVVNGDTFLDGEEDGAMNEAGSDRVWHNDEAAAKAACEEQMAAKAAEVTATANERIAFAKGEIIGVWEGTQEGLFDKLVGKYHAEVNEDGTWSLTATTPENGTNTTSGTWEIVYTGVNYDAHVYNPMRVNAIVYDENGVEIEKPEMKEGALAIHLPFNSDDINIEWCEKVS